MASGHLGASLIRGFPIAPLLHPPSHVSLGPHLSPFALKTNWKLILLPPSPPTDSIPASCLKFAPSKGELPLQF